jgi:hypothetical protein
MERQTFMSSAELLVLLFRSGAHLCAVEATAVRLVALRTDPAVVKAGGQFTIQYQTTQVPVLDLGECLGVDGGDWGAVIVLQGAEGQYAIAVTRCELVRTIAAGTLVPRRALALRSSPVARVFRAKVGHSEVEVGYLLDASSIERYQKSSST